MADSPSASLHLLEVIEKVVDEIDFGCAGGAGEVWGPATIDEGATGGVGDAPDVVDLTVGLLSGVNGVPIHGAADHFTVDLPLW